MKKLYIYMYIYLLYIYTEHTQLWHSEVRGAINTFAQNSNFYKSALPSHKQHLASPNPNGCSDSLSIESESLDIVFPTDANSSSMNLPNSPGHRPRVS